MSESTINRDSVEYVEILSDVFAELVRKAATPVGKPATAMGRDLKSLPNKRSSLPNDNPITPSLAQCLEYIYLHGPSPIRKIAAGLSVSDPAASQLVDRLVQRNLVTREHSNKDRRLAKVNLTEDGSVLVRDARAARVRWLHEILDRMPADRRSDLVDSLEEFIRLALECRGEVAEACARCGIDHLAFCVVGKTYVAAKGEPLEEY